MSEEISHLVQKFVLANGYPTGLPVYNIGIALGWGNLGAATRGIERGRESLP